MHERPDQAFLHAGAPRKRPKHHSESGWGVSMPEVEGCVVTRAGFANKGAVRAEFANKAFATAVSAKCPQSSVPKKKAAVRRRRGPPCAEGELVIPDPVRYRSAEEEGRRNAQASFRENWGLLSS